MVFPLKLTFELVALYKRKKKNLKQVQGFNSNDCICKLASQSREQIPLDFTSKISEICEPFTIEAFVKLIL